MIPRATLASVLLSVALMWSSAPRAADMPAGFVYLRDVDPSILQDMRYATPDNFTGQRVRGYKSDECVLAEPVAKALAKVQLDMLARGLSLKVYDCYRPDRAVKAFLRWARQPGGTPVTRAYHPGLSKRQVVARGYVAPRSTHSTGRAVDLTVVDPSSAPVGDPDALGQPCTAPADQRQPDTSVDMGTGFDCFHVRSHTDNPAIRGSARKWRRVLRSAMHKHGFRNYAKEWWHFNFPVAGFAKRHDFVVPNRGLTPPPGKVQRSAPQD